MSPRRFPKKSVHGGSHIALQSSVLPLGKVAERLVRNGDPIREYDSRTTNAKATLLRGQREVSSRSDHIIFFADCHESVKNDLSCLTAKPAGKAVRMTAKSARKDFCIFGLTGPAAIDKFSKTSGAGNTRFSFIRCASRIRRDDLHHFFSLVPPNVFIRCASRFLRNFISHSGCWWHSVGQHAGGATWVTLCVPFSRYGCHLMLWTQP
eukprot:g48100.t1